MGLFALKPGKIVGNGATLENMYAYHCYLRCYSLLFLYAVAIKSQDQTHSNVFTPSHSSISKEEQNPHNLTVGSAVQQGNPPNYGVIKWIGKLNGIEKLQAGVEMVRFKVVNHIIIVKKSIIT